MTSISKNVYIDTLDDIVNEHNNTYHKTIKMKPLDVNSSTYIDLGIKNNDKDPQFKVGDQVRTSNIKTVLQEVTSQIVLKTFL